MHHDIIASVLYEMIYTVIYNIMDLIILGYCTEYYLILFEIIYE